VARTFKTLSLSLPPGVVEELSAVGRHTDRTAARVAAEIVLRDVARIPKPKKKDQTRQRSWCCQSVVVPVQGHFVMPETRNGDRRWVPVIVLLCMCGKQMHGREYEGWIADA
jgi:hypothetical protein